VTINQLLLASLEQVTVGAARRVGEVRFAIGMTGETRLAREGGLVAVARVAARAVLMFGDLMQTKQRGRLVASGAGGR